MFAAAFLRDCDQQSFNCNRVVDDVGQCLDRGPRLQRLGEFAVQLAEDVLRRACLVFALLDGAHVQHGRANAWLERNLEDGWASCPITQNGCIRIMSRPAYANAKSAAAMARRLAEAATQQWHEFWADEVNLLEPGLLDWSAVLGARQVADAYLLALSVPRGGRFVSFDGGVDPKTVPGAKAENLVVL